MVNHATKHDPSSLMLCMTHNGFMLSYFPCTNLFTTHFIDALVLEPGCLRRETKIVIYRPCVSIADRSSGNTLLI